MKKKKKSKLFIFLIICFVLVPFLLTKGCNYMESLNQAKNSVSEPITSISEQIQPSAHVYAQAHSISKANWTGTAVPNSGDIEKLYINYNLSYEEIMNIIGNIDFIDYGDNQKIYVVLATYGNIDIDAYSIIKIPNGSYYICKLEVNNNEINITDIYMYCDLSVQELLIVQNTPVIDFGSSYPILTEELSSQFGQTMQNNKLSSLFSITPFEQDRSNELSIGNLFTQLGNAIIIFGSAVVNVFISMEPIFWNEGPTLIFILLIASVSFALVFWGIELLISLISVFKTKRKKKK